MCVCVCVCFTIKPDNVRDAFVAVDLLKCLNYAVPSCCHYAVIMRDHLRFQRAYNTKKDADDRPMSMWISRTEQLSEARELLGELVWAFMNEIWPSTKPIKTWKTSNKSYSYSLLNCINKMYTQDLFYLQPEWEAWLAPVYKQIRTTKSQLTQCTKYKCH